MPTAPKTFGQITKRHRNGTRTERGYDNEWLRFRLAALASPEDFGLPEDFMYCQDCKPRLVPTQEIHHRIPLAVRPDLKYEPTNLVGLCKRCHSRRTARGE